MQADYRSNVSHIVLLFSFLIPLSASAATPATLASDLYQGTMTVQVPLPFIP